MLAGFLGHRQTSTAHLLLALILNDFGKAGPVLRELQIQPELLLPQVENYLNSLERVPHPSKNPPFSKNAEKVLKVVYLEMKILQTDSIESEHLLFSMLRFDDDTSAGKLLTENEIDYEKVLDARKKICAPE